jgi:small subunit ribosomal protein S21
MWKYYRLLGYQFLKISPRGFIETYEVIATGERMVRLIVRDRESIQEAVRRFRKLVERSGIKKEMRRREYYEKPSEVKRRARLRAERRSRRSRIQTVR